LDKAPDAFRTISEVAEEINVPQHVLRFWESRFSQIRPLKRGGGRRYYRPLDVDLLRGVRHLLYGEGYTIRGVQRILREQGLAYVQSVWRGAAEPPLPDFDDETAGAEDDSPDIELAETGPAEKEPSGRREPKVVLPPLNNAAATKQPGIHGEGRRKLQSALDELIACRRLLDAALAEAPSANV